MSGWVRSVGVLEGFGGRGVVGDGGYKGSRCRFLIAGRLPGRRVGRAFGRAWERRRICRWRGSVRPCPVARGFVFCGVIAEKYSLGLGFRAGFDVRLSLISGRVGASAPMWMVVPESTLLVGAVRFSVVFLVRVCVPVVVWCYYCWCDLFVSLSRGRAT